MRMIPKKNNRRDFIVSGSTLTLTSFFSSFAFKGIANDQQACSATSTDPEGPYYLAGAPNKTILASSTEPGQRLFIMGTVYSDDCITVIPNAAIDVWHASASGLYDLQGYNLRGFMNADQNGSYGFETILPANYPGPNNTTRARHIHFKVSASGYSGLTTQLYFDGDPYIATDAYASKPKATDRIISLTTDANNQLHGSFDIYLSQTIVGIQQLASKKNWAVTKIFPNPISSQSTIQFYIAEKGLVELLVFDIQGKQIKTILKENLAEGEYSVNWDKTNDLKEILSSGLYILQLRMNGKRIQDERLGVI